MTGRREVDALVTAAQLFTMDEAGTVLAPGAVAIDAGRIVAVGDPAALRQRFAPSALLEYRDHAVLPGLVDTYTHAGHGLVRGLFHPEHGWPAGRLYWSATSAAWWSAEAELAALERTLCGVTTSAVIVGSTPARCDESAYALAVADAHAAAGLRVLVGVGPPDRFFSHLEAPWTATRWDGDDPRAVAFTYEQTLEVAGEVVASLRRRDDDLAAAVLAPPYLFGRHVAHRLLPERFPGPEDASTLLADAERMRALADAWGVGLHTHMFAGSVDYALTHGGADWVAQVLGRDVVVAHANGLAPREVEALGAAGVGIAVVPSTHENLWYGLAPMVDLALAGARVSIASDGAAPYRSLDLWRDLSSAVWNAWRLHHDQSVLAPMQALRAVTSDAAQALGLGDEIGSLEVGKRADLVALDLRAPHLLPIGSTAYQLVHAATGADVSDVIVNGVVLLHERRPTRLDPEAVRARALDEARRAFARHGTDDVARYRWS